MRRPETDQPTIVAIAGAGMATPLGQTAPQTWQSLLRGEYINDHSLVPQAFPKERSRVIELASQAAREAVVNAGWSTELLADPTTAIVVGTSKGPVERWLTPLSHMAAITYIVGGLDRTGIAEIAAAIAADLQQTGPRLTISAACATGILALIRGVMMIRSREADRVLVVAAESSVHPLFLGSFARLGVLAKPGIGCRPFDSQRCGFLMSEAAAAVCLEPKPASHDHNAFVRIERFALGGDATHITDTDPNATTLRRLLHDVLANRPVDLVHAHGTATLANDAAELAAIDAAVSSNHPPPLLYSHKGALGHSLGAAGLVAVVINCLAHRHAVVPGNVQTQNPLAAAHVHISQQPVHRPVRRSITIAAGFGGAMAVVSLASD